MSSPASLKHERDEARENSPSPLQDDYNADASSSASSPPKKQRTPEAVDNNNQAQRSSASAMPDTPASQHVPLANCEQLEAVFRNMRLRRIVKENHGGEINQLAFFLDPRHNKAPFGLDQIKEFDKRGSVKRDPMDTSNVLGTTGGPQANIYDNEHCGDHLDIMSHFLLEPIIENDEEVMPEMLTCCWMHQPQDAILATAGTDRVIHILSLARSKELRRLEGHTHTITDIQANHFKDHYLLSASKDSTVRLWNILTGKCICIFEIKASVTCFNPNTDGRTFLSGGYNGEVREWEIPDLGGVDPDEPILISADNSRLLHPKLHAARIDCIRFCQGKVLSKSVNGKIEYWDPNTLEIIRTFTIKNSASNQCRFDVSMDQLFFCVGTSNGSTYIYNVESGKMVTELKHRRSTKAIRTCVFTRDSRSVVCGGEDSFIWRYDYVTDEVLEEWAKWKPEA
ncbi:hypothetical protein BGW42_006929 [Actinomortierella wolfii]|nr:hypothetical protein BGW42_006929 [Actinomortierella wolfii]